MNKKPKLGKSGLSRVFGDEFDATIRDIKQTTRQTDLAQPLSLKKIKPNPFQPRRIFNRAELRELANSIKQHGVLQPILVRLESDGSYTLIVGERRFQASKLNGNKTIPAIVLKISELQMREMALAENLQRVNLSPIEEAYAFQELVKILKITQEQLANRIHKSRVYVTHTLRLLKLPKNVHELLLSKKMAMGHARPLVGLIDQPKKLQYAVKIILQDQLTTAATESLVRSLKAQDVTRMINESPKVLNAHLAKKFVDELATPVRITNTSLIIKYRSINQLNKILQRLKSGAKPS